MIRPSLPGDLPYLTRLIKIAAERGEILPRSDTYLRRHVEDGEFFSAVLNNSGIEYISFRDKNWKFLEK